jgi:hypothetical protein
VSGERAAAVAFERPAPVRRCLLAPMPCYLSAWIDAAVHLAGSRLARRVGRERLAAWLVESSPRYGARARLAREIGYPVGRGCALSLRRARRFAESSL